MVGYPLCTMQAHLVQLNIRWEDPAANFCAVSAMLGRTDISPGDLILLPEMFDTGFSLNIEKTADTQQHTHHFLADLAHSHSCFVQGGRTVLPERDAQNNNESKEITHKAHNRMSIFDPDGRLICDSPKIHPFSFGREPERFVGGSRVMHWDWTCAQTLLRVCPVICYDLRFPEIFRIAVQQGAELFALGACWPAARKDHWRALAIARAIENQAFVLAVNRTGDDPHLHYAGGSIAVGPAGAVLGELGEEESVLSVEIDPMILADWRTRFPALRDIRFGDIRLGSL